MKNRENIKCEQNYQYSEEIKMVADCVYGEAYLAKLYFCYLIIANAHCEDDYSSNILIPIILSLLQSLHIELFKIFDQKVPTKNIKRLIELITKELGGDERTTLLRKHKHAIQSLRDRRNKFFAHREYNDIYEVFKQHPILDLEELIEDIICICQIIDKDKYENVAIEDCDDFDDFMNYLKIKKENDERLMKIWEKEKSYIFKNKQDE